MMKIMHTHMILKMHDDLRNVHNYDDDQMASIVTIVMILTFYVIVVIVFC
jgi:hypothetical protein